MLICPQCQTETNELNKFCLQCGGSLTSKRCPACGTTVSFTDQECPNCTAFVGTTYQVLLEGDPLAESSSTHLDPQERYRILDLRLAEGTLVRGLVLDSQPFQTPLGQPPRPQLAQTYQDLQGQLYSAVPKVGDSWLEPQRQIVLLEDRSRWTPLGERWQKGPVPALQLLHWLHDLAQFWQVLEPHGFRQTVLELDNLRLDEDESLGFQYLYPDPGPLTLADLGHSWQKLLENSPDPLSEALVHLLSSLIEGKLQSTAELSALLEQIVEAMNLPDDSADEVGDDTPTVVLPMQLYSVEDAALTDNGSQRSHNEDSFGVSVSMHKEEGPAGRSLKFRGLYILCDGMGGHAGGEVASALAVKTLQAYFQAHWGETLPTQAEVLAGVQEANQAIYDINQEQDSSGSGRMGTTLVLVLVQDTDLVVAHVGDSRLYRLRRKEGLEQLTVDHEVGQREIQWGVDAAIAYARPDAYQLTQALGPRGDDFINPDIQYFCVREDSLFLLCSDGLSDNDFLEEHWQEHLKPLLSSQTNLEQGVARLVELGNNYNGHDNITALAVRIKVRPNMALMRS